MIDMRQAARLLGGDVIGRDQVTCPGPGHTSKDRSLSVRFDPVAPEGFIVNSFANDDPIGCRDHVRERLGLPAWQPGDEQNRRIHSSRLREFDRMAMDRETEQRPRTEDDLIRIKRAQALWNEASDPRGTVAVQYLKARALELPDDLAGRVLRFHPRCPWRNEDTGKTERIPALLAAFRSIDSDEITAVHRIRLDQPQRWPKADRRMLGPVHHTAVKLDPCGRDLIIGEGIETCMAARQLGHKPAWALGSVGAISFFPIVDGVKRLLILGETGKASEEAIRLCGRRWQRAWRRVQIIMPDIGSDINDELIARAM
jgi:Toprim domain-containing protein